jgi:hypothetical protein
MAEIEPRQLSLEVTWLNLSPAMPAKNAPRHRVGTCPYAHNNPKKHTEIEGGKSSPCIASLLSQFRLLPAATACLLPR